LSLSPSLAEFIELVARDDELRRILAGEARPEAFTEACARLAETRGLIVNADEVRALLRERAMVWQQRHIL
jgi:hypothetical protein